MKSSVTSRTGISSELAVTPAQADEQLDGRMDAKLVLNHEAFSQLRAIFGRLVQRQRLADSDVLSTAGRRYLHGVYPVVLALASGSSLVPSSSTCDYQGTLPSIRPISRQQSS